MPLKKFLLRFLSWLNWLCVGFLLVLIKIYRLFLSPYLGKNCRYNPSCSRYAMESLKLHGFFVGSYLTIKRLLKCNPWGGFGEDPVPSGKKKEEC